MNAVKNYQRLKKGEVHVYTSPPETIDTTWENCLDSSEQERANSFKFSNDRHLYITAHIYLRKILSQYGSLSPSAWRFQKNVYGKPFIANDQYTNLYFNLSHTQGMIACIVSYRQAVGIDVEQYKQLTDFEALCHTAFSPLETADILSLKDRFAQERRFFTYWTLKESYIKALGTGLYIPLQQFSFIETVAKKWELQCHSNTMDNETNWWFSSTKLKDHFLATAVASPNNVIKPVLQLMPGLSDNILKP
jgi:4'-phosphopantetheinyl transferase